jgi:membrane fusion protein, multidrug efflux system
MSIAISARETALAPSPVAAARIRKRPSLKRLALAGVALALLAGGARYGHDWWTDGRFIESTDDSYVGGNVTAIAPHISGFIANVAVTDNQRVRAGQLLVQLDSRDYRAALDHGKAVVGARAASLEGARAEHVLQQATIRQQEAELAAKSAELTFATEDAERYRSLATTSAGSRQNAERTTALERQTEAGVAAANAALEAGRQKLTVLAAQISEAEANLAEARSDLQTAELNLGYTEIRAPVDGYVGNHAAQVGAYVASGAYLLSVIPTEGLWVDANFKEDQLARMVDGAAATVTADALPGHVFHGRVASLAPGTGAVFSVIPAENATGNFTKIVQRVPVRVVFDGGDAELRRLRPGLSTTASVDTRTGGEGAEISGGAPAGAALARTSAR